MQYLPTTNHLQIPSPLSPLPLPNSHPAPTKNLFPPSPTTPATNQAPDAMTSPSIPPPIPLATQHPNTSHTRTNTRTAPYALCSAEANTPTKPH